MGRQAAKKVKQRRAEQKRFKLRTRALAALEETFAEGRARVQAFYDAASPAEQDAFDVRAAKYNEASNNNPGDAAAGASMAKQLIALPISRDGSAGEAAAKDEYPRLRVKVVAALRVLHNSPPASCAHLTPNSPVGSVCIDEPDVILCMDCADSHQRSDHSPEWNHTCLDCGGVDMRGISCVMIPPILALSVRFGDEEQLLLGPCVMTGLGLCNPCRLATGKKRARAGGAK